MKPPEGGLLGDVMAIESMKEGLTKYMGVIGSDHAYIHDGIAFTVLGITGSIAAGATTKFRFTTPTVASGKYIHWRPAHIDGISTGVTYELYESPTASAGSTATPINRNRLSSNTSAMQLFNSGATVSGGTLIQIIGGGTGSTGVTNAGGTGGAQNELVLAQNTEYAIVLTNRSGSTATLIVYEFFWYEETSGLDEA